MIISRSVLLRMRNVSHKSCRENQNTHFVFSDLFFFFENRVVYEIMWRNMVERGQDTDGKIIWRMRFSRQIPKATDTHSEYVILIAFPRQKSARERGLYVEFICTLRLVYFD